MNLIFLGPPGSGKGTQAERLARQAGLTHLSTGDLLRAAVRDGTELGQKAENFMKAGELVPDDVIIGLIEEKLKNGALTKGFVLDGFPRTIPQAEALEGMFVRTNSRLDRAILLGVDDDEIIRRLSGRFLCTRCQTGYNYPMSVPKKEGICDRCGGALARRPDDEPAVVENRLDVYKRQTQPIEDFYRRKSVLLEIRGAGTPEEIYTRITQELGVK